KGSFQIAVRTVLPSHSITRGRLTLTDSRRPVTKVHLVTGRRGRNCAAAARGLQLEHQVGDVDRGCGGEALRGRLEPAHDALEGRVPVTGHDFATSRVTAFGTAPSCDEWLVVT